MLYLEYDFFKIKIGSKSKKPPELTDGFQNKRIIKDYRRLSNINLSPN